MTLAKGRGLDMTMTIVARPLQLETPKLGRISDGGYKIGYAGKRPAGAQLLLGLPNGDNAIDVTHKNPGHLIDAKNLAQFLALIGKAHWWGAKGRCRLFLKAGDATVPVSNEVTFDCPVQPLICKPRLGGPTLGLRHHELYALKYAGEDEHGSFGRYLNLPGIDGCYYFRSGKTGGFEIKSTMRGLVCTSYIGAVWGIAAKPGGPMTWTGTQIASCSGPPFNCADVGVRDRPLAEVKAFLIEHSRETFLVGSKTHIALVVRGVVHDFTTAPRKGYNCRPVSDWHPRAHVWTVGKPQLQF